MKGEPSLSIASAAELAIIKAMEPGIRTATTFISEKLVVRVTRRTFKGKVQKGDKRYDLSVSIGKPNYKGRQFVKRAKRDGRRFPIVDAQKAPK